MVAFDPSQPIELLEPSASTSIPDLIARYADMHGMDPNTALAAADIESGIGRVPDTKGSRYTGLFQLGPDRIQKFGRGDDYQTPEGQAAIGIRSLVDSGNGLAQKLKRDIAPHEMYLAHQQGVAGANALLNAPADMLAADAIKDFYRPGVNVKAITGNLPKSISRPDITAGEFRDYWRDRFGRSHAKFSGIAYNPGASYSGPRLRTESSDRLIGSVGSDDVAMAAAPAFDPSQPFEIEDVGDKPAPASFDPSQPFELLDDRSTEDRSVPGGAIMRPIIDLGQQLRTAQYSLGYRSPEEYASDLKNAQAMREAYPPPAGLHEMESAQTLGDFVHAAANNPMSVLSAGVSGAIGFAPAMVGAGVASGLTGGIGGVAGMAATAGAQRFMSTLGEMALQKAGPNASEADIAKVITDPAFAEEAKAHAKKMGLNEAAMMFILGGFAGKAYGAIAPKLGKAAGVGAEVASQVAGGAGAAAEIQYVDTGDTGTLGSNLTSGIASALPMTVFGVHKPQPKRKGDLLDSDLSAPAIETEVAGREAEAAGAVGAEQQGAPDAVIRGPGAVEAKPATDVAPPAEPPVAPSVAPAEGIKEAAAKGVAEAVEATKPEPAAAPEPPRMQAGEIPEPHPNMGESPSLLRMLASHGGIRDEGGELAQLDLLKQSIPGIGKLVRPDGLTLEQARALAEERGYLRPSDAAEQHGRTEINDLLSAIDAEARGNPVYPQGVAPEKVKKLQTQNDALSSLEIEADRLGIDTNGMTPKQIDRAIRDAYASDQFEADEEARAIYGKKAKAHTGEELAALKDADLEPKDQAPDDLHALLAPDPWRYALKDESGKPISDKEGKPVVDHEGLLTRLHEAIMAQFRHYGLPEDFGVRLMNGLRDPVSGAQGDALYRKASKLIDVALTTKGADFGRRVFHEALHVLADPDLKLLKPHEIERLNVGARAWLDMQHKDGGTNRDWLRRVYKDRVLKPEDMMDEARSHWGEMVYNKLLHPPKPTRAVIDKISRTMEAIRNGFHGLGFRSSEGFMRSIEAGKLNARRYERQPGESAEAHKARLDRAAATRIMQPYLPQDIPGTHIKQDGDKYAIRAWHGTPHDFDRFDIEKIGTGEGAQAYGHGLYFAGNRKVAEGYRDNVIDQSRFDNINKRLTEISKEMSRYEIGYRKYNNQKGYDLAKEYDKLLEERASIKGKLYEVSLRPDEHELLDWDKTLSEQPEGVRKALDDMAIGNDGDRGSTIYNKLATMLDGDREAAQALREAGIPGIRYLDAGSRATSGGEIVDISARDGKWFAKIRVKNHGGVGFADPTDMFTTSRGFDTEAQAKQWADSKINEGSRNYVIFDDADVSVQGKYALRDAPPEPPAPQWDRAGKIALVEKGRAAMRRVLDTKQNEYHAAYRPDTGWISFLYGDDSKGISHLISERIKKDGLSLDKAREVALRVPDVITNGKASSFYVTKNGDVGRNVNWNGMTASLRYAIDGDKRNWVVTGFEGMKTLPADARFISKIEAERKVADALLPGSKVRQQATQLRHQPVLRAQGQKPADVSISPAISDGHGPANEPRLRSTSTELGAATDENITSPAPKVQPSDDAFALRDQAEKLKGIARTAANSEPVRWLTGTGWWRNSADAFKAATDDIQMFLSPMAVRGERGSDRAAALVKRAADAERAITFRFGQIDQLLKNRFKADERAQMGRALDLESVHEQRLDRALQQMQESGEPPKAMAEFERQTRDKWQASKKGIAGLNSEQRFYVDLLAKASKETWQQLKAAGVIPEDAREIPFYMPRMLVKVLADGGISKVASDSQAAAALDVIGANVRTSGPKRRKYLTPEETEAAAKLHFGDDTELVTDIRALPLALAQNHRSINGRRLIDSIEAVGKRLGMDMAVDPRELPTSELSRFFTLAHPSFTRWQPKLETRIVSPEELNRRGIWWNNDGTDQGLYKGKAEIEMAAPGYKVKGWGDDGKPIVEHKEPVIDSATGKPVMERVQLHIAREFEGPLRAFLTSPSGGLYNGLMKFKGLSMQAIMYSPMIHLGVEYGRAFPLMPGKMLTLRVFKDGNAFRHGKDGLATADYLKAIEEHHLAPIGQSWYQDITGIAADAKLGERGKVMGALDKFGHFWHQTLLWDRIADLQAGIYVNMKEQFQRHGKSEHTAGIMAAHLANRYAGALPKEAMGETARRLANVFMFSRSYTIGNLGVMKDVINGMPRDVRASISAADRVLATKEMKSEARKALMLDLALFYSMNSALQIGFQALGTTTMSATAGGAVAGALTGGAMAGPVGALAGAIAGGAMGLGTTKDKIEQERSPEEMIDDAVWRLGALAHHLYENPLDVINPFDMAERLTPNFQNEEGKRNRIWAGREGDNRGIYMANPLGKFGEDIGGWITSPDKLLHNKGSQLFSSVLQAYSNKDSFGHRIYRDDDPSAAGKLKAIGDMVWHIMKAHIPTSAIEGLYDAAIGMPRGEIAAMKAIGPLFGVRMSSGYPGGPDVGNMAAAERRLKANQEDARPIMKRRFLQGRDDEAQKIGEDAKFTQKQINSTQQSAVNPRSGPSKSLARKFDRTANEEMQDELERVTGGPR